MHHRSGMDAASLIWDYGISVRISVTGDFGDSALNNTRQLTALSPYYRNTN
jgi:hypothetical protein